MKTKTRPRKRKQGFAGPMPKGDPTKLALEVEKWKAAHPDQVNGLRARRELEPLGPSVLPALNLMRRRHGLEPLTEKELKEAPTVPAAEHLEELKRRRVRARETSWAKICPPKYAGTWDQDKTPAKQEDVAMVLDWQYGPTGLFIIGETGRSKTWALWTLLTRLRLKERRSVIVLDGVAFANEASAAFSEPVRTEKWLRQFVEPDIFAVDDLAKRFTPAAQQALFAILDRRTAQLKPFIATSNCSGEKLDGMINDPQLAEPLRRRMRDHCRPIIF